MYELISAPQKKEKKGKNKIIQKRGKPKKRGRQG